MIYIALEDLDNKNSGVAKKINDQIRVFNNNGITCTYIRAPLLKYGTKLIRRICTRLPFTQVVTDWNSCCIPCDTDVLYVRYTYSDIGFLRFLNRVKKRNPNLIIFIEVPTYPYTKEIAPINFSYLIKDQFYARFLKKYVDNVVTFSKDKYIYNIPCINIVNGINFCTNCSFNRTSYDQEKIRLVAVASMQYWHGYDIVIKSLWKYYKQDINVKEDVHLYLVGEGPEIPNYRNLVKKFKLGDYVHFLGQQSGDDLINIYQNMDVGLCSLGAWRKNIILSSELKSREYVKHGLPFISNIEIDVFPGDKYNFVYYEKEHNTLDINSLCIWYKKLRREFDTVNDLSNYIHNEGKKVCDIQRTMLPVIDKFKKLSDT